MGTPLRSDQQAQAKGARRETVPPAKSASPVPPMSAVPEASPTSPASYTPPVPPAVAAPSETQSASAPPRPGRAAEAGAEGAAGLVFHSDPEAKWPPRLAALICLLLVGWMALGQILSDATDPGADGASGPATATGGVPSSAPVSVAVRLSQAAPVTLRFRTEGYSMADRDSILRAEMSGHLTAVPVQKGAQVEAGQVLATLQSTQRVAALQRAEAGEARARREYETAEALHKRGATTETRLEQTREALAAARAELSLARQGVAETRITAPFAGHLETLSLIPGAYVQEGEELARIVATDPLRLVFQVPQNMRAALELDRMAQVQFLEGSQRQGRLAFLGRRADPSTRSFAAELLIDNPGGTIPAGISARIEVPLQEVDAHFLSPALLSLDMDGVLGVKSVDDADRVVFTPVEIVRSQPQGVWVTGLPDQLRLITVGQGFVTTGEPVRVSDTGPVGADVKPSAELRP
ncbi:efflux RND transporter periplasmic adaptor subunit [Phaeobacter porticola]|uniref:Putative secretion protein, HylD family n=1 Tax=Phaeobacter porticola TaxID=1844006 RepID=A0A1L3IBE7_9RHOB|nr:efflux RND transporter periplasmic adaptor subunit [Phaeobacter porticola]APG49402.1 putative secretion protein, HylD family [Phaeobacter porticola]